MLTKITGLGILMITLMLCLVILCSCTVECDYTFAMQQYLTETSGGGDVQATAVLQDSTGSVGDDGVTISDTDSAQYLVDIDTAGYYNIMVDYYILHNGLVESEIDVTVQDYSAQRTKLLAMWTDYGEFEQDNLGNDVLSLQYLVEQWLCTLLYPNDYSTATPLVFYFDQGCNEIELCNVVGGEIIIANVQVVSIETIDSYNSYLANNNAKDYSGSTDAIILEAETPQYKNSSSIIPYSSGSQDVTPFDTYTTKLNIISNFYEAGEAVTYQMVVGASGFYNIGLNYMVDNSNRTTFVTVMIDGSVPFGELLHYPLPSNSSFSDHLLSNNGDPFKVYLEAGTHTITFCIDGSLVASYSDQLLDITTELNSIYLDLKKVVGASGDTNRQWDTETDFPDLIPSLEDISSQLATIYDQLKLINGLDANYQALINITSAIKMIDGLLEEPMYIPNNYADISEGTASIVQTIVAAREDISYTPLDLDAISISSSSAPYQFVKVNFFSKIVEAVKKFFYSFTADYSSVQEGNNVLNVWVARPRQYVDIMQQMIDSSDFAEQTGYDVQFSMLADEGKIILSSIADIQPNACFGISNWLPYEMGIRGLTVDISQYDDYSEIINRFSTGAIIPLIADEIAFGLPETQDFYVMYYRQDILDQYNIPLPDTWDDVVSILPELHRYGMNFYIPLSSSTSSKSIMTTAPFILQQGGTLFSSDASTTTIDDANSIEAIKMMTELYTLYGLPLQVTDFFDSFRNGSLPIGISTFETYVKLSYAAPEIAGLWDIALSPGTVDETTGEVLRYQAGSSTSVVALDSGDQQANDATWELLKWWTSTDVQSQFANRVIMSYGNMYIWNSANLEAFDLSMSFSQEHKDIIIEQWEYLQEISRVPGWYMLERELSNLWNDVVLNGINVRVAIEEAADTVNKELKRKLTEFGYMDGSVMVNPYTLTTMEYVEILKNQNK